MICCWVATSEEFFQVFLDFWIRSISILQRSFCESFLSSIPHSFYYFFSLYYDYSLVIPLYFSSIIDYSGDFEQCLSSHIYFNGSSIFFDFLYLLLFSLGFLFYLSPRNSQSICISLLILQYFWIHCDFFMLLIFCLPCDIFSHISFHC